MTSQEERDAARRYLEHDHAAQHLDGEAGEEANRHAEELDDRHPRARDIALTGTERELGKLPPHLARHQREARQLAGISTEHAARIRNAYRAPEREGSARPVAPSSTRRSSRSVASYGGGLLSSAGDTGWGSTIVQIFSWGMGLSIAYLLLTRVAAVSKLAQGATNVARAVVSPAIDPLNPRGVTPRPIAPARK
jgi:hypothetical protein